MAPIRRLVLDVLKPHSPSTVEVVRDLGGTVHSVDEVVAGETLVEYRNQPQDPSPS